MRAISNAFRAKFKGNGPSRESFEGAYPTLTFPPPAPDGQGTRSLCARCLTLLSHVVTRFGDGSSCQGEELPHSPSIGDGPSACVICTRTKMLFDAARIHVSFEETLRKTAAREWNLVWGVSAADSKTYPQYASPYGYVSILITARHNKGYGWGIGGFKIFPDSEARSDGENEAQGDKAAQPTKRFQDDPSITALDPSEDSSEPAKTQLDFSSTVSPGSMSLVASWGQECAMKHAKCRVLRSSGTQAEHWHPDRLVRLTTTPDIKTAPVGQPVELSARIVEKSDPEDFPPDQYGGGVQYFSLSHCWGPPPDPSAPLGGREKDVLTQDKLSAWKKDISVDDLPLTFQHAIKVCITLHVEHVWIDSLCIIQDSREDWLTQSAVMADVYKYAWLNIAALSSASDEEGFINNNRDPRVEFGFRASFSRILGRSPAQKNQDGQNCVLLDGQAALTWNFDSYPLREVPLYKRAWVYQERSLALRTLGFTKQGIHWACDGFQRSEYPGEGGIFEPEQLRTTIQAAVDTASALAALQSSAIPTQLATAQQTQMLQLLERFDYRWLSTITSYTLCGLTRNTDRLIAFSAIVREYNDFYLSMQKRYLAGFWEINLPFQMAWITVEGKHTPKRKMTGEEGYVAPSWSWASIEAPVQPRLMFPKGGVVALANVIAADVVLQTDFKFGPVKAGWLRVCGRLNRVKGIGMRSQSLYLDDQATGEDLWFTSDTIEGRDLPRWRRNLDKLVWMPLTLTFSRGSLGCTCLVLAEVNNSSSRDEFVKPGEKVYRRLGSGNFGRIPSMLQQDKLLLRLGTYPEVDVADNDAGRLEKGFKRNEEGFEEIVLI